MKKGLGVRTDTVLYPRDLQSIDSTLYQPKESELIARRVFSLKTDDPEWAETIGYDKQTRAGSAAILNLMASNLPFVDVDVTRAIQRVHTLATAWKLRFAEVEAARAAGKQLEPAKAAAARRYMAAEENSLAFNGDSGFNILGVFTSTDRLETSATNGDWDTLGETDGPKIVADIRKGRMAQNKLDGFDTQVLILSSENYEYLGYFMSDRYDITVLEYLRKVNWFPGGIYASSEISSTKIAMLDNRPEQVQLSIPKDMERLDPWKDSPFSTVIPVFQRISGLVVRFPQCISVVTGIQS